ncbi:hypothetical protein BV25DRAFT_248373 [Artomyces pyxidatus]|uniref:Uncharacterized protein n=1 Tax=Artomyces pyxidatus TaxID=48021 RepID=A0ACB8T901_9AGAM|nr:hypothetical protein BV25DRAFT_248373 [Artomyces pyxidatus]
MPCIPPYRSSYVRRYHPYPRVHPSQRESYGLVTPVIAPSVVSRPSIPPEGDDRQSAGGWLPVDLPPSTESDSAAGRDSPTAAGGRVVLPIVAISIMLLLAVSKAAFCQFTSHC